VLPIPGPIKSYAAVRNLPPTAEKKYIIARIYAFTNIADVAYELLGPESLPRCG